MTLQDSRAFSALALTHTRTHTHLSSFLSASLLVGVKRVMSADLCVLLHRPITFP